jgi:hypothetical protein
MKKWVFAAIGYLLVVIVGYSIYSATTSPADSHATEEETHGEHGNQESASEGHGEHDGHGTAEVDSEVKVELETSEDELTIFLTDQQGNPVEELEINHEKLVHLIIVDEHLDQYFHLHPEEAEAGVFVVQHDLEEGAYKAFIDIKPKGLVYNVEPIAFNIGDVGEGHGHHSLEVDTNLKKTVNGVTVDFKPSFLKANENVALTFSFPADIELQPYLGAMGHVVILDETGTNYIHVHPLNDTDTIFETKFPSAGVYKLWAEFQIENEVFIYSFTVEIE